MAFRNDVWEKLGREEVGEQFLHDSFLVISAAVQADANKEKKKAANKKRNAAAAELDKVEDAVEE